MLVVFQAFPVAAPNESVFAEFFVTQVVVIDFADENSRAVGIGRTGFRVDGRLSVADDDARIEQRVDVHGITVTVSREFARVADFAVVECR